MTAAFAPMLPSNYTDYVAKVRWDNATAQPCFSGQRCFVYLEEEKVKITTTTGVTIKTVPHINNSLQHPLTQKPETVLDGFLIQEDVPESELKKHLKKFNQDNSNVKLVICDQILNDSFMARFKPLEYFVSGPVECAETVKIRNREDLSYYQSRCLAFGYSGACLRHSADGYKSGPVICSLIVNTAKTKDFFINDLKPGKGDFAGLGVVICETSDAEPFEVVCPKHVMSLKELIAVFSRVPPNKLTTAYFDYTLGDDSVPKFPVAVKFK